MKIYKLIKEELDAILDENLWHGSPHDFEEFLTDYMGSGEGVQAFGWGLYFTELEDIAKKYADELGGLESKIFANNKEISSDINHPLFDYKSFLLRAEGNINKVLEELIYIQDLEKGYPKNFRTIRRDKAIKFLEKNPKIKIIQDRNLYKIVLNKNNLNWLEWDKPINLIQTKQILSEFNKINYNGRVKYIDNKFYIYYSNTERRELNDGKNFYRALAGDINFSEKKVSKFLLDAGIDGIKYPAESIARGKTSETARGFNYVIFDPSIIKIEKKIKY